MYSENVGSVLNTERNNTLKKLMYYIGNNAMKKNNLNSCNQFLKILLDYNTIKQGNLLGTFVGIFHGALNPNQFLIIINYKNTVSFFGWLY